MRAIRSRLFLLSIVVFAGITLQGMDRGPLNYVPAALPVLPEGVQMYVRALPRIERMAGTLEEKAKAITDFMCKFSNSTKPLLHQDVLMAKILSYVKQSQRIACILLGYPTKSSNTQMKVIAAQFDMAELVGLLTLNHMMHEIESVYAPGAVVQLYTREPFIYQMNQVALQKLGIELFSEADIEKYQADLKKAVALFQPYIQVAEVKNIRGIYEENYAQLPVSVEDISGYKFFMEGELDSDRVADAVISKLYLEKKADLVQKFKWTAPYNSFADISTAVNAGKLAKKKRVEIRGFLAAQQYVNDVAQALAEVASKGALRMRALMNEHVADYSSYVRLSIHTSETGDVSSKLGIGLIHDFKGSPWHGTLGVKPAGVVFGPKNKVSKNGTIQSYKVNDLSLAYIALA